MEAVQQASPTTFGEHNMVNILKKTFFLISLRNQTRNKFLQYETMMLTLSQLLFTVLGTLLNNLVFNCIKDLPSEYYSLYPVPVRP
jgi:hypothetical protein